MVLRRALASTTAQVLEMDQLVHPIKCHSMVAGQPTSTSRLNNNNAKNPQKCPHLTNLLPKSSRTSALHRHSHLRCRHKWREMFPCCRLQCVPPLPAVWLSRIFWNSSRECILQLWLRPGSTRLFHRSCFYFWINTHSTQRYKRFSIFIILWIWKI